MNQIIVHNDVAASDLHAEAPVFAPQTSMFYSDNLESEMHHNWEDLIGGGGCEGRGAGGIEEAAPEIVEFPALVRPD